MESILIFVFAVLISGWACCYLLARATRRHGALITRMGVFYSLLAVATPSLLAFALSSPAERVRLAAQFLPRAGLGWYALSVVLPLAVAVVGHVAGILTSPSAVRPWPPLAHIKLAVGFLPLAAIWGLLEEIGWRGYLVVALAHIIPAAASAILVGIVWGLWHAPQMFLNPALKKAFGGRAALGAALWIGQCTALSCLFGWLQFRTGSFVFPAMAHALVNVFEKMSFGMLGEDGPTVDPKWAGNTGIPALGLSLFLAVILLGFY